MASFADGLPFFFGIQTHAADRYHLRLHRARSVILTDEELVEVRAAQRTFEGAYVRTALSQFSFALVSCCFLLIFVLSGRKREGV